jgi:hypothetical protein
MVYPAQRRMKIASPAIAGTGLLEKSTGLYDTLPIRRNISSYEPHSEAEGGESWEIRFFGSPWAWYPKFPLC